MAFGVLEPRGNFSYPTGTVLIESDAGNQNGTALHPQPTSSANDPLNMSSVRKEIYFVVLMYGACVVGVVGPLLVPGFSILATYFDVRLTDITLLNGSLVVALGVSSYICAPLAFAYGCRLVYLTTTLMMLVGCLWASFAETYGALLASRIFQGLGMGAFFSLAGTISINEVFFVHERGRRVGLWNFAVIVSINMAPLISGYVITALSWQWSFQLLAIAFGLAFCLEIFWLPEITFERAQHIASVVVVESATGSVDLQSEQAAKKANLQQDIARTTSALDELTLANGCSAERATDASRWKQILGINNVRFKSFSQLVHGLVTPLRMLKNPAVLWASAMWSVTFTWVIIQGAVADQIYRAPPYNLSATAVGQLISLPPLIGSALGTVLGGYICDASATLMSRRNNGLYEPEFRLVVFLPSSILTGIGSYGLGIAISNGLSIWASAIFLAFLNCGIGISCTGIVAYTNDVCQQKAAEAFGIAMLIKSIFAFGLTFMLNDYYALHGATVFFATWATLTLSVTLMSIPLYIFGKRIRAWAN